MLPSTHYDHSQEAEYPKQNIGRDPRVWSSHLSSHHLPPNTLNNSNTHPTTTINTNQTNGIPFTPNEYDYPTTAHYPKKDIGRDPRVWSPNLLSHRIPPENQAHHHHQQQQQTQQTQIPPLPNNYYENFEYYSTVINGELYPKKNIGRDPRVWSPNLLSHRLPSSTTDTNAHASYSEASTQNQDSQLSEYSPHYDHSQEAEYPKKNIGRDPRVWSPNLLSHRLPSVGDKQNTEAETTATTTTTPIPSTYTPNEFEYSRESEYPKKDIGRDPRVWSPNLLSHRLPSENSKKNGEIVYPVKRYSRAKL